MSTIKIYGTGCPKCIKLADNTSAALRELDLDWQIEKVDDITVIMQDGIAGVPALSINGNLKSSGKVADMEEIKSWLVTEMAE